MNIGLIYLKRILRESSSSTYLVHCSRTGLKPIELATSRLLARIVEYHLVLMRDLDIRLLLTKDHIEGISLGISNGDQRTSAGCVGHVLHGTCRRKTRGSIKQDVSLGVIRQPYQKCCLTYQSPLGFGPQNSRPRIASVLCVHSIRIDRIHIL